MRFENAYTPAAICFARACGGRTWDASPQQLREAGYNVGLSGKWHLGQHPREFGMDGEYLPGWYYSAEPPDYLRYLEERDLPEPDRIYLQDAFPDDGETYQSGCADTRPADAHFTRYITERAIEQLDEYCESVEPFYGSVHYFGSHTPYYLPEEYFYMYDQSEIELPESAIKETFEKKP